MLKAFKFSIITCCFLATLMLWNCDDDDSNASNNANNDSFNRQAMLTNWADNIIIPAFTALNTEVAQLKTSADSFSLNPSETNFNSLRTAWEDAYIAWQRTEMFIEGPADEIAYIANDARNFINSYPTNAANIDNFISSGDYDLTVNNTFNEQGFPALDYLLFGLADTDAEILALYTSGANGTNYLNYLTDVTSRLQNIVTQIETQWSGNYRNTFINNSGSSSSASVDLYTNDWLRYFEIVFRNGKIGIPAGNFSATQTGNADPEKVEAFYKKDLSKTLALEAITAFKDFFNGKHYNNNTLGESYASYLNALNRSDITNAINEQLDTTIAAINNLDNSFYNQINTNNVTMRATYDEVQANVVLIKVDMLSALNITLVFNSGDGD